jgi:hypothetical protein
MDDDNQRHLSELLRQLQQSDETLGGLIDTLDTVQQNALVLSMLLTEIRDSSNLAADAAIRKARTQSKG